MDEILSTGVSQNVANCAAAMVRESSDEKAWKRDTVKVCPPEHAPERAPVFGAKFPELTYEKLRDDTLLISGAVDDRALAFELRAKEGLMEAYYKRTVGDESCIGEHRFKVGADGAVPTDAVNMFRRICRWLSCGLKR